MVGLGFIRELPVEQKALLMKLNKDKKRWYKEANAASGNKLFKTSFHDYAHSAPKSMGDIVGKPTAPLGLDNASEAVARHTEDSVLQGLPWAVPKSQMTDEIRVMQEAQTNPNVTGAYDALYKLGQYSVEKKNGLQAGAYPASKVMLNKFSYASTVNAYFRYR